MYCLFVCLKDVERVMGCTGSPADSHDIRWYTIHKEKLLRCGECGSGEFCGLVLRASGSRRG
jgi:hypothetical protein